MGFKNILNDLFSTDDQEDENVDVQEDENEAAVSTEKAEPSTRQNASARQSAPKSAPAPQSFTEVGTIADHLMNHCTVVLNLETTTKETARRIVDFLNGVSYSMDGQIKPVANNTFVITPKTVSVTGASLDDEPVIEEPKQEDSSFDNF